MEIQIEGSSYPVEGVHFKAAKVYLYPLTNMDGEIEAWLVTEKPLGQLSAPKLAIIAKEATEKSALKVE